MYLNLFNHFRKIAVIFKNYFECGIGGQIYFSGTRKLSKVENKIVFQDLTYDEFHTAFSLVRYMETGHLNF